MVTSNGKLGRAAAALAALLVLAGVAGRAAEPLNPAVPLRVGPSRLSGGEEVATLAAARRAQELGLPTVAAGLYRELLARPGAARAALTLPLATALLDAGEAAEAEQVLNALPAPRGPEWRLRMGLAETQLKQFGAARAEADRINVDDLQRPDRAWFWFLRGALYDTAPVRDITEANKYYVLAESEAPSDFARATFMAAEQRVRLTLVTYSPADVEALRTAYEAEQQKGRAAYQMAEDLAVRLDATGKRAEAVRFLSGVLGRIPHAERHWTDRLRMLLGLIGDRRSGGAGRNALTQLLENGTVADYQREALQLLAEASQHEPERALFAAELDHLIAATPKPAILDSILLMRAQLALSDPRRDFATAEKRANELINDFPGSRLLPNALVVLATSAWEQRRYLLAADEARQAREAFAATPAATAKTQAKVVAETIAELRVLEAEASFRAGMLANSPGDFRNAADAYAAALRQPPAGIKPGDLLYQRALSEIRADADDPTKDLSGIIDKVEADPRFDPVNRWDAEWSLARVLMAQGKTGEALGRVTRLLDTTSAAITPDLRARMSWLQARLSYAAGQPKLTLELLKKFGALDRDIDPALRTEIASTAALLQARAEFALDREADALATLRKLRADFPKTDAAIYSYLVTADYYAAPGRDKIQDAQRALRSLVDNPEYKTSEYVPYALFQLALLSERLGQEKDLEDANNDIEELVKSPAAAANPDLVFAARLKQGDLLRMLNRFPRAQVAYEDLVNNPRYAHRPDVVLAQLRLAECHNAQSSTDPTGSHADIAQSMFEALLYRVDAPADVRVEAGYNLGKLLERRGQADKARDVWWRDVITPFLLQAKSPAPAGAKRPYWLARTLLDLGALLEQHGHLDEARRAYALLRDSKLGYGESIAVERLQRLGITTAAVRAAGK